MIKLFKQKSIKIPVPNKRVDERDTMFARMARKPNNSAYKDYYSNHPELKKKDDHIRSLPLLLHPKGKFYDIKHSEKAKEIFESIDHISIDNKIINQYSNQFCDSNSVTNVLKQITLELGAVAVGTTKLEKYFIYSHKGRFDSEYGNYIDLQHPSVIVFLVEMDINRMQQAPKSPTIFESANQYYHGARISKTIEKVIHRLGYEAKAHYDAHYDIILPPLAAQAGLGEIGRNNILITNKYGSRVRIGAVTTNLILEYNRPISIGVDRFCNVCKKCSENCPSRALTNDGKSTVRGIDKWNTDVEKCYSLWRIYGTDCGICMAVCPFSHKNNIFHNIVRNIVKYIPIFNKMLVFFDNLIYGKSWRVK